LKQPSHVHLSDGEEVRKSHIKNAKYAPSANLAPLGESQGRGRGTIRRLENTASVSSQGDAAAVFREMFC
jgi:hypothetical protein